MNNEKKLSKREHDLLKRTQEDLAYYNSMNAGRNALKILGISMISLTVLSVGTSIYYLSTKDNFKKQGIDITKAPAVRNQADSLSFSLSKP